MAYSDDAPRQQFAPRQTQIHDVSSMGLKCAECQTAITELPFVPSADRPVYCRDCNRKRKESFQRDRRW
ncbi:MAG: hypothetical protein Q8R13_01900 [bacterium]|nr:hypothetical protein [bacterium]MDZ4296210.1 CxxC-x17-CxxC domain-containing protein [Patescibacteria group bacterium]